MELPLQQKKLFELLSTESEVNIDAIYHKLFEKEPPKNAQQLIGPYISKLNRRISAQGLVVKPGKLKRTYALLKR